MAKAQVGMIGLAVMGSNLIKNIESRGYTAAVYNRSPEVTDEFMRGVAGRKFVPGKTLPDFVQSLERPRRILVMVKAGGPVDAVIDQLMPLLEPGDLIADLGNSYFKDTQAREARCKAKNIHFIGVGVSGGEEGALKGPSIMSGGPKEGVAELAPIFDAIAARVPEPCHAHVGPDGAGHFVKMVHNGIEYGDMQLIAEAYHLLRELGGAKPDELAQIFTEWNKGVLSSFLIEITAQIFHEHDPKNPKQFLVDQILDKASQKGTGKWTAQLALDLGSPIPTLAAAVDARVLSSLKSERQTAAKTLPQPKAFTLGMDRKKFIEAVHDALFCSKIVAYAQGMRMLQAASDEWKWNLNLGKIASIWRGGCIIRAQFLNEITRAYDQNPALSNLLLAPTMVKELTGRIAHWREIVALAANSGIPVLAFGSSLSYFDSYRLANLPQNLTQAQRDFFGAHTFERLDAPGTALHHEWSS